MEIQDAEVIQFQEAVGKHSVYDLSEYSLNSLKRRLIKIVENYDNSISNLIDKISTNEEILESVIKQITVNTTELFRDPKIWIKMISEIIPKLKDHSSINIWHAGCSTGQEVYSMMIVLDQHGLLDRTNIYASDINSDVLQVARQGKYRLQFNQTYIENFYDIFPAETGSDDVTFSSHNRYFTVNEIEDTIRMADYLRKKPVYEKIDLVKDDNLFYVNFDLVFCRNVIIYFNSDLQSKVLRMFHRNLREKGFLVLGLHESIIGNNSALFSKYDAFYRKI